MPKNQVLMQRKLLDALMGAERNSDLRMDDQKTTKHYTDPDVCKNFICGLCPHVLFDNTRMDMGDCPLKHSEVLRVDYELSKGAKGAVSYDRYLFHTLVQMVGDCDRKIERAQERLRAEAPDDPNNSNLTSAIQALCAKAEELGEQGKINESMEVFAQAEELKRKQAAGGEQSSASGNNTQQQLRVCDVCGAFLSIFDSNRRLADHFGGKLHIGYLQMRERLDVLKKELPQEEQDTPPPPLPTTMPGTGPDSGPRGPPMDHHQSLRRMARYDDRDDDRQRKYRDRDADRQQRGSYDRDRRDRGYSGRDRDRGSRDRYGGRHERERERRY